MKALKVLLWLCGIGCFLSLPLMVMPWSVIESICRALGLESIIAQWFGAESIPNNPLVVYAVRTACAVGALSGVFFIIMARDPVRYRSLVILTAWGLVFIGLVCLVVGLTVKMKPPLYIIDVAFCLVLGIVIDILSHKAFASA